MKNKKGFTLVEVLAVIALLGIILLIATPAITRILNGNKKRIMAEDAIRYLEEIENKVNSDTSIEYPSANSCKVFDLEKEYSEDRLKSPFGGTYKGFVELKMNLSTPEYKIYLYSSNYETKVDNENILSSSKLSTNKEKSIQKTNSVPLSFSNCRNGE